MYLHQIICTVLKQYLLISKKRGYCVVLLTRGSYHANILLAMVLHSGHDLCRWALKTLLLPLHNVIVKQFLVDYFCLESPTK